MEAQHRPEEAVLGWMEEAALGWTEEAALGWTEEAALGWMEEARLAQWGRPPERVVRDGDGGVEGSWRTRLKSRC
jgi:hypothetical protein